jgi:hypothetical protein
MRRLRCDSSDLAVRRGNRKHRSMQGRIEHKEYVMGLLLLIVVVLLLVGGLPTWGYSRKWGYGPSGGFGLLFLILVVLLIMNVIPRGF